MKLVGCYNKSVILTWCGVALSVVGMCLAFSGEVRYALICMMSAAVCDLFDGTIARRCKRNEREKAFGIQLDSLADTISFVAFPVVLFVSLGLTKPYSVAVYVLYVLAGITRLGWYNVLADEPTRDGCFHGLPVTYSALIFPVFWTLSLLLGQKVFGIVYTVLMALTALLFVLDIKIPRPRKAAYVFFLLLFVAMIFVILFAGV